MDTVRILFPIKEVLNPSEDKAVAAMHTGIEKLLKIGALKGKAEDILKDYEIDNNNGYAIAIIDEDRIVDPSKLNTVGATMGLQYKFPVSLENPDYSNYVEQFKNFSAATLTERLRLAKANPKLRLRYMIMDYKRYFKQRARKLKDDPKGAKLLRTMFLNDMMGLFSEILPLVVEGKQLNTILGVSQVNPKMMKVARDLSMAYKRSLKQQATAGQISKTNFKNLRTQYNQFMSQLMESVMPGIIAMSEPEFAKKVEGKDEQMEEQKSASLETSLLSTFSDGSSSGDKEGVLIDTSNSDQLIELLNYIKELGNIGHSFTVVVDPGNTDHEKKFEWDGDGADHISNIVKLNVPTEDVQVDDNLIDKKYSYCKDGRIKLFD